MGNKTVGPNDGPGPKPGNDGRRNLTVSIGVPTEGITIPAPDLSPMRLYDEEGREVKPGEPMRPGHVYVLATADVTAVP